MRLRGSAMRQAAYAFAAPYFGFASIRALFWGAATASRCRIRAQARSLRIKFSKNSVLLNHMHVCENPLHCRRFFRCAKKKRRRRYPCENTEIFTAAAALTTTAIVMIMTAIAGIMTAIAILMIAIAGIMTAIAAGALRQTIPMHANSRSDRRILPAKIRTKAYRWAQISKKTSPRP